MAENEPSGEKWASEEAALKEVSTFEDLLKALGTEGRWSNLLFILCAACAFVSPMQTLSYQFLGGTPDHWCHVDALVEANWTDQEILSLAIPMKKDKEEREGCYMYDYNYSRISDIGYNKALSYSDDIKKSKIVSCEKRIFNLTQYKSTITTEWDLVCNRRVLYSTTQAAAQAGKFIGYLFTGYLLDSLGRRPVILACSVMTIISGYLSAASPNVGLFIFLRIVVTCMTSGVYLGCFVMSMETCSSEQRSRVGSFFVLPWAVGYMVLPGIAYLIRTWQWLQAALTVPALFLVAYFWLLPESPRWLILKGRHEDALNILKKAVKMNGKTLPYEKAILNAMERVGAAEAKNHQEDKEATCLTKAKRVGLHYFALLRIRELRHRTLVVYFCWFAASMVYYGVALNATNLSADPYIYVFLGGVLEVPSYLLLWPAVVHVGRKKSLAILYGICGVSILIVMTVLRYAPQTPIGVIMFLSLTGKMAITAAFHLAWMFTAELFPTKYRSLAVGQASVKARVGSICSPYINDILGEVVVWAPSLLFGVVSLISAGLSMSLPETRGKDLPESNDMSLEARKGTDNSAYVPEIEGKTRRRSETL